MNRLSALLVASVFTFVPACSTSSSSAVDEQPVLDGLATNVILPTLRDLDSKMGALSEAVAAFSANPTDATLTSAQNAWKDTRVAYRHTEAFRFGPAESKRLTPHIDYFPANAQSIEDVVSGTTELNAAAIESLGSGARGLHAMEALLFDAANGNTSVLTRYTTDTHADRRKLMVTLLGDNVKTKTATLLSSWEASGENFVHEFTAAGSGSATFPSRKSAIDQLVNQTTFAAEEAIAEIAKPAGKRSGGSPLPAEVRSAASDNSMAEVTALLDGAKSIYEGSYGSASGPGLGALVKARNSALDGRVITGFQGAQSSVAAVPHPFRTAITTNVAEVDAAYESVRTLKVMLSTEVASLLGTTLQFNDNDGD